MKIGTIGTGNMAGTLGRLWAAQGHRIFLGSRDPIKAKARATEMGAEIKGGTYAEAVAFGKVILLAPPWHAAESIVKSLDIPAGKILIDCINPLVEGELALGHMTSAAEQIAHWAPEAHIVKAFNSIHFAVLVEPQFGSEKASFFYCGDDLEAKAIVAQLGEEIGFEPIDAGALVNARLLEPLGLLWIRLAFAQGQGANTAFKLLHY